MLGKKDIYRELGKGICIFPLHKGNIKENSINLSVSQNVWTLSGGDVVKTGEGQYRLRNSQDKKDSIIHISKGSSAVLEEKPHGKSSGKYVILFPHSTTVIETSEALGVDNRIGGTLHSKVGLVAQGIGDTSTMLGPCFCGHLMISIHNVSNEVKVLKVGETFVSLVFYYLQTANEDNKNSNVSGHVDKLSELGISIDKGTREYLMADWKQSIEGIRQKMEKETSFQELKRNEKEKRRKGFKTIFSVKNIAIVLGMVVFFVAAGIVSFKVDKKLAEPVWFERFWTALFVCVITPIFSGLLKLLKK